MRRFLAPLALFGLSLALYATTLAPTVVTIFDDSLELQLALPTFAIIHPTGYPTYSLLGWLATKLIPLGDMAWRANFFSALAASAGVAMLYVVARRLGSASLPAFVTALVFSLGPVWWSQSTIAEVYAAEGLIILLILYALLRWDEARGLEGKQRWLIISAFLFGLGLTHHRMTLLLVPAALIFIIWGDRGLLRRPRQWIGPLVAALLPLLLYGILPLRSEAGSLDGSYSQIGFWGWVLGGGYSVFLRDNPFGIDRSVGDLLNLWGSQYGILGILLAIPGYPLWLMQPRRLVLLALITVTDLLFASQYKVADIEVFLLPLFIVWAFFIALGFTVLWDMAVMYLTLLAQRLVGRRSLGKQSRQIVTIVLGALILMWPLSLYAERVDVQDRNANPIEAWGVHDYGLDMLESMEDDAVAIGILGEITLLRYFQETQQIRPNVSTQAADAEDARLAAISAAIATGAPTYTTRPLSGLAEQFRLSTAGPLIRVRPGSQTANDLPTNQLVNRSGVQLTPSVALEAWELNLRTPKSGSAARLQLLWHIDSAISQDFKISTRLLAGDGTQLAQVDDFPVHNSYPPTAWRSGEAILDSYDLPLAEVPSEPVTVVVILYDPASGSEIARWEQPGVAIAQSVD